MLSLLTGTLLLAAVHALIPNHWLPLVAVAKAERWKAKEITTVTLLAAAAHVFGTIVLGVILGFIGKELEEEYGDAITVAAAVLLIVFGLVYFTVNLPHHHHSTQQDVTAYKRSKKKMGVDFCGDDVSVALFGSGKLVPFSRCVWDGVGICTIRRVRGCEYFGYLSFSESRH